MTNFKIFSIYFAVNALFSSLAYAGDGHEEHEEEENAIVLTQQQMRFAGIQTKEVKLGSHARFYFAPGEVKANGYTSYLVSPRADSIVLKRHTTLGSMVNINDPLITLFSEAMAQAQAQYLVASTEWDRVKRLSKETISERERVQASADFSSAYSKLLALGVTEKEIKEIATKPASELGQYTLVAEREGVVTQDAFTQGQHVASGTTLMAITDESELWVEARLQPNSQLSLAVNSKALIGIEDQQYAARVIQEAHTIDPITRTRQIRLLVENSDDKLHAGMFVNVNFIIPSKESIIALPADALSRGPDGDWVVYIEEAPGEFHPKEVTLGEEFGAQVEVIGLAVGERVAVTGAFFIASEQAKAGFDPHNH
ncbi:efflux RND transporter periplasmic adaptor subunit [Pseudoalteromonas sp. NJ631]|uniref:efflux RND transporter periplasmic adaptor subunit n=1 Tax=Pseudoalteromonas sp. NJ631 TaxID=493915 RepID=UPI0002D626F0|nr:efflux RND transporter periplasmic adaptor subunit [Pseudoalteromonas sp. NJ631]